jgi:hypothetical protein
MPAEILDVAFGVAGYLAVTYWLTLSVLPLATGARHLWRAARRRGPWRLVAVAVVSPLTWLLVPAGVFFAAMVCLPDAARALVQSRGVPIGMSIGAALWILAMLLPGASRRRLTLELGGTAWLLDTLSGQADRRPGLRLVSRYRAAIAGTYPAAVRASSAAWRPDAAARRVSDVSAGGGAARAEAARGVPRGERERAGRSAAGQ